MIFFSIMPSGSLASCCQCFLLVGLSSFSRFQFAPKFRIADSFVWILVLGLILEPVLRKVADCFASGN